MVDTATRLPPRPCLAQHPTRLGVICGYAVHQYGGHKSVQFYPVYGLVAITWPQEGDDA